MHAYLKAEPWRSRVDNGAASYVGRLSGSGVRCDPRTPAAGLWVPCRHPAVTKPCPFLSRRAPTNNDARLEFLTRGRAIDTKNALGEFIWRGERGEEGR